MLSLKVTDPQTTEESKGKSEKGQFESSMIHFIHNIYIVFILWLFLLNHNVSVISVVLETTVIGKSITYLPQLLIGQGSH